MGKTLLILGNGFDINWGLNTRYGDFIKDAYKGDKPQPTNLLINTLLDEYDDNGWIDVERSLRDYALSYNDKPIKKGRNIEQEFNTLCKALCSYMYSPAFPSDKNDSLGKFHYNAKSTAVKVLKAVSDLDDVKIYSFNYTNMGAAIDSLNGDGCSLNKKDIVYIHGMVTSSYDSRNIPIILGFDNNLDVKPDFNCMIKVLNPLYKNGIIGDLSDAEHVVFFGFGLGITDFPYFESFFNDILTKENPEVKISVFDINSTKFLRQIDIITRKNIHLFREKCDLKTYNVSNISDKEFKEFQSRLQ